MNPIETVNSNQPEASTLRNRTDITSIIRALMMRSNFELFSKFKKPKAIRNKYPNSKTKSMYKSRFQK